MRRLISKSNENKKKKRNRIILGIFLVFTMFFSVIGFGLKGGSLGNSGNTDDQDINTPENNGVFYNGFEFIPQNGFWILNKNNTNFIFRFNPNQIEKVNSTLNPLNSYSNKKLYISSENVLAESEIRTNLGGFVQGISIACLNGEECSGNRSIKTCKDNFIIIKKSNNSKIIQEDNCVFIDGKESDLIKLADEFLFKILGIRGQS